MSTDRWERVEAVFSKAASLPPGERAPFLADACGGDGSFRAEVEELLAAHDVSIGPLDRPLFQGPEAVPSLSVGQTVSGRFRIRRFVGRGGMGEVYEAEDLDLGVTVALKTLLPEHLADPHLQARFRREIHLARRVTHANVCRVFDLGKDVSEGRETNFLTMQFLEGVTLAEHLRDHGRLTPEEALPLIRQMAEGLTALAEAGIVHRDFKPGNIMLTPAEDQPRVVIMDFGLARPIAADNRHTILSTAGLVMGTPAYMAPEQLLGEKVGPYSDVYALAVVTYELLTGSAPFKGNTVIRVMLRKLTEVPPAPTEVVPGLDVWWDEFVSRCMERDVEKRVQSPQEVLRLLDELESGQSAAGRVVSVLPIEATNADVKWAKQRAVGTLIGEVVSTARRTVGRWRPWILVSGTTAAAAGVLMVGLAKLPDPARSQLCDWFPGSAVFCVLPEDKDLALLEFETHGGTQGDREIAAGLSAFITDSLYQLYPNPEEFCVHPQTQLFGEGEKMALSGSIVVDRGWASLRAEVREIPTSGSTSLAEASLIRRVSAQASLDDLSALREGMLTTLAGSLEIEFPKARFDEWARYRPRNGKAFLAFLSGLGSMKSDRTDRAATSFSEALRADPSYAEAAVGVGDTYRARWNSTRDPRWLDRASNAYRRAIGLDPSSTTAKLGLGDLAMGGGHFDVALDQYVQALELRRDDYTVQTKVAEAYDAAGQSSEAEKIGRLMIRLRPNCPRGYNYLAGFYDRQARYEQSERELMQVIRLAPWNSRAYNNLAIIYIKQGRYADAIDIAAQGATLPAASSRAYSSLGRAYLYRGCPSDALVNLRHAVTLDSDYFAVWTNLAEAYAAIPGYEEQESETFEKVERLSRAAIDKDPGRIADRSDLALSLARKGQSEEAVMEIQKALDLDPESRATLLQAAVVFELLGRRNQAFDLIRKGLKGGLRINEIEQSTWLASFRSDPGYVSLLRESGEDAVSASTMTFKEEVAACPEHARPGLGLQEVTETVGAR